MHHKLDVRPIPEEVLYINDLSLAGNPPYARMKDVELALTGRRKKEGGILPDDNVRIYVPMNLNADEILHNLYELYRMLGDVEEQNEYFYSYGVGKLISQLEIYDQVWVARGSYDAAPEEPGVFHSREGIALARRMVEYMEDNEGCAECFPYEEIEKLREAFGL